LRHKSKFKRFFVLLIIGILIVNIFLGLSVLRNTANSKNEWVTSPKSSATFTVITTSPYGGFAASGNTRDENYYLEWSISTIYGPGFSFYMMNDTELWAYVALASSSRTRGNFAYTALLSDEEASASGTFYPAYSDTWWFVVTNHYTGSDCSVDFFNDWYDNFITVDEPTNSRAWEEDTSHYVNWTWEGDFAQVDIDLYHDSNFVRSIATNAQNNGSYLWRLPDDISLFDDLYQLNISNTDFSGTWGISDSYFEIKEKRSINITRPSASNSWENDTSEYINWTSTGVISNVIIELYNDDAFVMEVTPNTPNDGEYFWAIPSGLDESYQYQIKITDESDPSVYHYSEYFEINFSNPNITSAPSNITVEAGYTGQALSWTATDANPDTYTIELQGGGIVDGPTVWTSGSAITYNIPDEFGVGSYIYTVNFTDFNGNFTTDSVNFTVEDTTNPVITVSPNNFTMEMGYTGQSLSWTATDENPDTYTIELQGMGIVAGPIAWTSGGAINYNILDGYSVGSYIYTVNFTDDYGYFITESVTFTVEDTINPIIALSENNITVLQGYENLSLLWTATDANPDTYTIELQGTGMVAGPTAWTSEVEIEYNIPDDFTPGVYMYTITFRDESGNSISDTVTLTIEPADETPEEGIPLGNVYLIFIGFSVIGLIVAKKRKIVSLSG